MHLILEIYGPRENQNSAREARQPGSGAQETQPIQNPPPSNIPHAQVGTEVSGRFANENSGQGIKALSDKFKTIGNLIDIPNMVDEISNSIQEVQRTTDKYSHRRLLMNFLCGDRFDFYANKGRSQIPLEHQVLFFWWFFATPDSYRSICEKFNVGKATGFRIIRRIVKSICEMAPNFIKWSTNRNDAALIWNGFRAKGPIPKVIDAIDGCHIKITKPPEDGNSFINGHHRCSIQLQAVCDHKCMFTHVYIGNCGSVHNQIVLRLSGVSDYLNNPVTYFPEDCHLIADSAYIIHRHLLVPFRNTGHLTEQQLYFNTNLSSVRGFWITEESIP
ncbi:hypothetical protein JTB14_015060 [Gonioctena quinquepunctata]|nr:hypothetical protein JTB14_015060 [Gonioctena quinquepunctata]